MAKWEENGMDIKIFVSHTPNRNTVCLTHPMFYHVIAGSHFQTKEIPPNMITRGKISQRKINLTVN